jgi:hypothetical protein
MQLVPYPAANMAPRISHTRKASFATTDVVNSRISHTILGGERLGRLC